MVSASSARYVALVALLGLGLHGCGQSKPPSPSTAATAPQAPVRDVILIHAVDDRGQALPGVTMQVTRGTEVYRSERLVTDSDGVAELRTPRDTPARLLAIAARPPLFAARVEGDAAPARDYGMHLNPGSKPLADVVVRFAPGAAEVRGQVRDLRNQPVAGARVMLRIDERASGVNGLLHQMNTRGMDPDNGGPLIAADTDAQGQYVARVPEAHYTLHTVLAPVGDALCLLQPLPERSWAQAGLPAQLDAVMTEAGALEISVTDADGQGVAGAKLRLVAAPRPPVDGAPQPRVDEQTDAQGIWHAWGISTETALVEAEPPASSRLAPGRSGLVAIARGRKSSARIVLRDGATISGRVLDEQGAAASGIEISVVSNGDFMPSGRTDATGHYSLTGLPSGRISLGPRSNDPWLIVDPGNGPGMLPVAAGGSYERDFRLRRQSPTTMRGTVTTPDGKPLAGAVVRAREEARPYRDDPPTTHTDADGHYELSRLLPVEYTVEVTAPHGALLGPARERASLPATQPAVCDVQMRRLCRLKLRVIDTAGKPVPSVPLTLLLDRPGSSPALTIGYAAGMTDADGRIDLPAILRKDAPADWGEELLVRIQTEKNIHLSSTQLTVRAADQWTLDRTLSISAGARVSGRVVDPDGKPVAGAVVSGVHTDVNGNFALENVPGPECRLEVGLDDCARDDLRPPNPQIVPLDKDKPAQVHLVCAAGGVLEGFVSTRNGQRVKAMVNARPDPGGDPPRRATECEPEANRPYRIRGLAPGRYRLIVSLPRPMPPPGGRPQPSYEPVRGEEFPISVHAGETVRFDIQLQSR